MKQRSGNRRKVFTATEVYHYPEHLRPFLAELPALPGVYVFHGDSKVMPLYIGKSINIRTRVMSHFRNVNEARLLRQSRRISYHVTAGEIGALLLEAQMIKQLQPLYNKRLRRNRQLCSLQMTDGMPQIVSAREIDFSSTSQLFGLFSNRRSAQQALLDLGDSKMLCFKQLGLEKGDAGRACFRFHLGRCAGACCGKETLAEHQGRLMDALQQMRVFNWPYAGPIGLVERGQHRQHIHLVYNWYYLGSVDDLAQAASSTRVVPGFDRDGYHILSEPILSGRFEIIELPPFNPSCHPR